ncbi:MAG: fucose isomerase [Kiritimatiellaeota bacterium]|nr:fucose isomerase [Kiritimatiellota bacterium]
MKNGKPLMGLCPIGKFVFSNEDAVRHKELLQEKLRQWQTPFVDLENVLEDGLVKDQSHVDRAVEHFRRAGVDCLFLPHCNFGTEGAAAMIAAKLAVPVLLWGPRDETPLPDGTRLRDTLCGLFATSKVLHKLGVHFSYIENCRIDDPLLHDGVDRFLRAVNVAGVFRTGVRIGHIGQRIDFFWTTIVNESELLERFGIEILPLDMVEFIRHARNRARENRAQYGKETRELRETCVIEEMDDDALVHVLAVRDQMLALVRDNGLEGLAVQDFMSLIDAMGAYCMFADSMVADRCAVGYESDIHGTISDIVVRRVCFNAQPGFLTDLTIRHPTNDNAVLLWHCGAALAFRRADAKVRLGTHWILPSPLSGMPHFPLKHGRITVARFDGDRGRYELAVGEGASVDGPETLNNAVWMEVDDWPQWERTLIEGPFIHHAAMTYGNWATAIEEAGRFVPGIRMVRLGHGAMG